MSGLVVNFIQPADYYAATLFLTLLRVRPSYTLVVICKNLQELRNVEKLVESIGET